jgi:queuine tRNA-ribosyltransferase
MRLSMKWAERGKRAFVDRPGYGLFGIVQGSVFPDLRAESVTALTAIGFDGYAVGGLAVGEGQQAMFGVLDVTTPMLPADRPRYLMGVGKPTDLVEAVARGVDLFDCVMPTRNARNGQAFTPDGPLTIGNARFARDPAPLDPACPCEACRHFSRAYLRHLFGARELLAYRLLSLHNVTFYLGLMRQMREAVAGGGFASFRARFLARYGAERVEAEAGADLSGDAPRRGPGSAAPKLAGRRGFGVESVGGSADIPAHPEA